jgi:hypothetical protein
MSLTSVLPISVYLLSKAAGKTDPGAMIGYGAALDKGK